VIILSLSIIDGYYPIHIGNLTNTKIFLKKKKKNIHERYGKKEDGVKRQIKTNIKL